MTNILTAEEANKITLINEPRKLLEDEIYITGLMVEISTQIKAIAEKGHRNLSISDWHIPFKIWEKFVKLGYRIESKQVKRNGKSENETYGTLNW